MKLVKTQLSNLTEIKNNRYDKWLMVLLAALVFGGLYAPATVIRILSVLLLPLIYPKIVKCWSKLTKYILFILLFLSYAVISFLWTSDVANGMKCMIYYLLHCLLFIEILVLAKSANHPLDSISKGWMIAVALSLMVALWEIATDNHLVSKFGADYMKNLGGEVVQQRYAAVTFFNYNNYVAFLCFSMPFIYYWWSKIEQVSKKNVVTLILLVLSVAIIVTNGSRGGIIASSIMFSIYLLREKKNKKYVITILLLLCAVVYLLISYGDTILLVFTGRMSSTSMTDGSSRYPVWMTALQVVKNSYGMGAGIGGLSTSMSQLWGGVAIPHNLFLELMGEFGVIFCFIFIAYLCSLFKRAYYCKNRNIKTLLLTALIPMPVYCIINSGYLHEEYFYVSLACWTVFANYKQNVSSPSKANHYVKTTVANPNPVV